MQDSNQGIMSVKNIVWMMLLAMVGVRWFTFGAMFGAGNFLIWIVVAGVFFIPMSFVVAEFGMAFPEKEGGMPDWVGEILGKCWGWMCSWYYFICVVLYLPTVLTFAGVSFAYAINPDLADNKLFIVSFVVVSFWLMIFLSATSLERFKKMSGINGFIGTMLPVIVLLLVALFAVFILKSPIPTDFSLPAFIPDVDLQQDAIFLIGMTMAFAGVELAGPFVAKMRNPKKEFPRAMIISAIGIVIAYMIGSTAILFIESPEGFSTVNGLMEVISIIAQKTGVSSLANIFFLFVAIGNLGVVTVWLVGPTIMLIRSNDHRLFPKVFVKENKHGIPINALVIQGVIVSLIMIGNAVLPNVESIFNTLVIMTAIFMFISYIMLFVAYLKMKLKQNKTAGSSNVATLIKFALPTLICVVSIWLTIISPQGDTFFYELQVIGGPILFGCFGLYLYKRAKIN